MFLNVRPYPITPIRFGLVLTVLAIIAFSFPTYLPADQNNPKKLAYLVSDIRIPFWDIMSRGIRNQATQLGYELNVLSADNLAKTELKNTIKVLKDKVDGLILSPTNSSASVTILKMVESAGIPVVIADIGTDAGEYVSFISSDNRNGAYKIGQILAQKMQAMNWQNGRVGIIAIPQKRANGQARTAGFMQAMNEAGIKGAGIKQQVDFSYRETYEFSTQLIKQNPDLRAIWLQGSDRYQGALDAIADSGKKDQILLVCFDAEPEFLELIPAGVLVGAAMQQPFLMGQQAVQMLHKHLNGEQVPRNIQMNILAVSAETINRQLPVIRRNVLGIE